MLKKSALAVAAATLLLSACDGGSDSIAGSDVSFYVTDGISIYTLNGGNGLVADKKTLTGLDSGTLLAAIDVNPRTGVLNGIGSNGQSYQVNPDSGQLTKAAARETTNALANKAVEIDYNPVVGTQNVYRVTTSTGDNYRVNDTSGAKAPGGAGAGGNDLQFFYKTGDVNAGRAVVISGIAYTDSQLNTAVPPSTTVYAIDTFPAGSSVLTRLGGLDPSPADRSAACPNTTNPNCGQLTTIGELGFDIGEFVGFDILSRGASGAKADSNVGYVTALVANTYNLYTIDLATGKLSFITALNPTINPVRSFAVKQ